MKLLVTGTNGFVGKILVSKLLGQYKDIDLFLWVRKQSNVPAGVKQIVGDLYDEKLYKSLSDEKFDVVVHCAGFVPKCREDDNLKSNIEGNLHMTSILLRNINAKKVVFISTCEVYGLPTEEISIITEGYLPKPISNYAKSKLLAEEECERISKLRNFDLCILRLTTLYGNGDGINRAIPNFVSSALEGREINIFGNGEDIRDYLYIEDAVDVIVSAIFNFRVGMFNVSSGQGIAIKKLAEKVIKVFKSSSYIKFLELENKNNSSLVFDNKKIKKCFGFKQKYSLLGGIQKMAGKPNIYIDFDGTLVDVSDRWYQLHLDLSKIYNFKPINKEQYLLLKRSGESESTIILKTNIPKNSINDYLEERTKRIELKKYLKQDTLKYGSLDLLKKMSEKFNIVLVTKRKDKKACLDEIKRLEIEEYFFKILISGSFSKEQIIIDEYREDEYKGFWMVGDTNDDCDVARKLEMKSILVCDGVRDKIFLEKCNPDFLADKLINVKKILNV